MHGLPREVILGVAAKPAEGDGKALGRRPNRTRLALLGFLSWGPQSGYGLRKVIDASVSNFWSESYGRIYPMLGQLVEEGLATSSESETAGGRATKTYSITPAGHDVLATWLAEPPIAPPRRNELLLKLFFAARAGDSAASRPGAAMVRDFRDAQIAELDRYSVTRAELEAAPNPPDDLQYWLMTLRYGELEAKAHLDWCDEILSAMESDDPPASS